MLPLASAAPSFHTTMRSLRGKGNILFPLPARRGTQVEDGGGSWISGFWVAGSFPAAAESVYVQWRPWRGGLSSHVEGPHLLRGAPWGGSEHAECLPEVAPRRGGETRVRGLSPSPHQVQALSLGRW